MATAEPDVAFDVAGLQDLVDEGIVELFEDEAGETCARLTPLGHALAERAYGDGA